MGRWGLKLEKGLNPEVLEPTRSATCAEMRQTACLYDLSRFHIDGIGWPERIATVMSWLPNIVMICGPMRM